MSLLKLSLFLSVFGFGSFALAAKSGSGPGSKTYGFRFHYGYMNTKSEEFEKQVKGKLSSTVPEAKEPNSFAGDFLYMPNDMVYGLRYELFGSDETTKNSNGDVTSALRGQRINALVGWRFLRIQRGYLGLLSHLNLGYNSLTYEATTKNSSGATETFKYTGDTAYGYGIAIDGAYYADGLYPTGIEIGYTRYAANSFKDEAGATVLDSSGQELKADISGLYFRFYVGFVF